MNYNISHKIVEKRITITVIIFFTIIAFASQSFANPAGAVRGINGLIKAYQTYRIISAMPRTAGQFTKVYQVAPTVSQFCSLIKGTNEIYSISEGFIHLENKGQIDDIWRNNNDYSGLGIYTKVHHSNDINDVYRRNEIVLRSMTESTLSNRRSRIKYDVVVGHSDGNYFRLPSGEKLNYTVLDTISKRKDTILIVISCESDHHLTHEAIGLKRKIRYKNALKIARDVGGKINELEIVDLNMVVNSRIEKINALKGFVHDRERYYLNRDRYSLKRITLLSGGAIVVFIALDDLSEG